MMRAALGLAAAAGGLATARLALRPLAPRAPLAAPRPAPAPAAPPAALRVDSLAAALEGRDPFRISHRPASVAYDPATLATALQPPPPRPVLVCTGIVWDARSPTAVVRGLPGVEGARVVRPGEVIGGVRVRAISSSTVVLAGMDTTWTLHVQEPSP